MMPTTATSTRNLAWACLNVLTKKRYEFLLQEFGSLENAWEKLDQALLQKFGCKEETIHRVLNECEELDLQKHSTFLEKESIELLTMEEERYPEALREIADPPVFLFAKGNLELLRAPSLAIVGTRKMSTYGKRVLEHLIPDCVHAGLVTVSGLAMGIDAETARQTMSAGGKTIAVLGHGLGAIYPRANARLAEEIVEKNGLLLTEYPLHITPNKYTFPARNRIIAGLSLGTVVAEAASQSGSLITAALALDYGKEVFAVPGQIFDPNREGTHRLIVKGGAKLITSAEDILNEIGIVAPERRETSNFRAQTPDEERILKHLSSMPQSADDLIEKSGLSIATVNATLTLMELKKGAKNVGGGMWVSVL